MDNLTHTLIGAALAETGLRRRTRYAAAALMIGANIPDVDVIAVPLDHSLEWRRGITHGLPALVIWPFVLTGLILLWHRHRGSRLGPRAGATTRARHERDRPPVRPAQLLLLSAIAVLTHPTYDWLNTYGMRWLMPLDGTWFYGDSLFIVDPILLVMLGAGTYIARRRAREGARFPFTAGRSAIAAAGLYTLAMLGTHEIAEHAARRGFERDRTVHAAARLMVAPTPANPFRWEAVAEGSGHYHRGRVNLLDRPTFAYRDSVPVNADLPAARAAARSRAAAAFLGWSRWPYYRVIDDGRRVRIADLRYSDPGGGDGWASVIVPAGE